uniref:WAP domain-containing protein n=1 Tax=Cyanistes caeruleus TaxID=156563 RepID=A0A8C0U4U4_CYACU
MLNRHTPSALPDQPKPSQGPTVQPGPFRERCRDDGDCPDAQKCCNSSCGQQCLPGAPAGETGWDTMDTEGGDMAQTPGMMPEVAATLAQSCGTNGTPHPMLARVGSAGSGVGTQCWASSAQHPGGAQPPGGHWSGEGRGRCDHPHALILLHGAEDTSPAPVTQRPLQHKWGCLKDQDCPPFHVCCHQLCARHCGAKSQGKDRFCPARAGLFPSYDCRAWCRHDGDCPRKEKCCLRGCDYVCLPPSREKPGICPLAEEAPLAPCGITCTEDWQCPGAEKCCGSSRCGYVCSAPEPDKPGECPKVRPHHSSEPCTEMDSCSHDRDCSRQEKCCFSGCAMRCTRPARGEQHGHQHRGGV